MNKTELKDYYRISMYTLNKWLLPLSEKINLKKGKQMFSPKEVSIIFDHLDAPETND